MTDRLSAAQWSRFWTKGSITTFIGRFADNYDGKVRDFWLEVFGQLERGARVVDLATGNGGLALLAQQYSRRHDRGFTITAVDYADIDPPRTFAQKPYASHLRRIRFLARTPLEATGLPRASIDAAISQFGFEYGKPGPAKSPTTSAASPA